MIRINNIKFPVDYKEIDVKNKINTILRKGIGNYRIDFYKLAKKSIDSRDKSNIRYVLSVDVHLIKIINSEKLELNSDEELKIVKKVNNKDVMLTKIINYQFPYTFNSEKEVSECDRPIIIGAGPAGYFAALLLAEAGFKPILFERGKDVDARTKDINEFWENNNLNINSNVSFGEGGAGTFSDGKLNTGVKDKYGRIDYVLQTLHKFGANESVIYDSKPHVGTDILRVVMKNMREKIISYGGEIYFNSLLTDIEPINSEKELSNSNIKPIYQLSIIQLEKTISIKAKTVILAIGHSARDTFKMLYNNSFNMEQKPFAIGLRIEHKREDINESQYGNSEDAKKLPTAPYKLTYKASNNRAVFSFCMCPGGYVVNASTEPGMMVVNGMSYSKRDADNSNSAIICSVTPDDYPGNSPLDAVEFQRNLEKKFYNAGEGFVPVQRFGDFRDSIKTEKLGRITPCIKGKYSLANLNECLPDYVKIAIIEAIQDFEHKIKGFSADDAILSGIESRTSSPVKITRDDNFMSNKVGIIPCGEGAGYAGGITSAAIDGIKCAEACAKYLLSE